MGLTFSYEESTESDGRVNTTGPVSIMYTTVDKRLSKETWMAMLNNPAARLYGTHERLCKIKNKSGNVEYVICKYHCCGEFWETSLESFCCTNNFKPIRNLFTFLAAAFFVLSITLIIVIILESIIGTGASSIMKEFKSQRMKSSVKKRDVDKSKQVVRKDMIYLDADTSDCSTSNDENLVGLNSHDSSTDTTSDTSFEPIYSPSPRNHVSKYGKQRVKKSKSKRISKSGVNKS